MSFTNHGARGTLNTLFGKPTLNLGTLSAAINWHLGASTSTPTEAGTGITEPVGNNYARKPMAQAEWTTATLADPSVIDNANQVTFNVASGSWGTITHLVLFDQLAHPGGNALVVIPLTTAKAIDNGDTLIINAGELDITAD
jgi:hypothetical protein